MRSSGLGRVFLRWGSKIPLRMFLLRTIVAREGGEMFSQTLRAFLRRYYGVEVGDYSYGSLLKLGMADRHTVIGRYVSIGANVRRFGAAHPLTSPTMHPFWYNPRLGFVGEDHDVERTGIYIGHDSWIGANVTILPRVSRIGIGAVIGAGSVVTKDVPDFAIAVGNPARIVSERFDAVHRAELLSAMPWELEPREADAYFRSYGAGG
jgi:acetyltransferase-like isoleucine patch superfamily enzyme